jgi:hypothetical protein
MRLTEGPVPICTIPRTRPNALLRCYSGKQLPTTSRDRHHLSQALDPRSDVCERPIRQCGSLIPHYGCLGEAKGRRSFAGIDCDRGERRRVATARWGSNGLKPNDVLVSLFDSHNSDHTAHRSHPRPQSSSSSRIKEAQGGLEGGLKDSNQRGSQLLMIRPLTY